ncbi:hypothetical protein [Nocardia sp. R7R-8]|uniref:hypothetical protein n=1 Tax=Nocardia sp. R7R-8 TaxID=3459304 RepID=UPI00403D8269
MNEREPTDNRTDDVPGTAGVSGGRSAGTGQPADDAAHGAAGEQSATQRTANTSSGAGRTPDPRSAAQVAEDVAAQAGGTADAAETVTSGMVPTGTAPQAGSTPDAGATVSSAEAPTDTAAQASAAAGAGEKREPESTGRHAAETGSRQETPVTESVRRAAERAEQVQADVATAAERGAAGIPGPVARPGRTLLETLRDKPLLAAIPAAVLAFIFWRALRRG